MNNIKKERSIGEFTRSSDEGKLNYSLIPLFSLDRIADLYTQGAEVHGKNNWKKSVNIESLESFRESAFRHFLSWQKGKMDEDHFAATVWNMIGYEYVKGRLNE